ncbi:alpha/beta fold hydrolase [Zunongwangia endophytica]|uniref:Alpha/beta fold hydrolase n=1 Tax=Zunongwangia endophytica TaxID=1808945 RepID=A0ABV8H5P3_9FLAO|nr:alpha/beta hydrolase [Zunongwangia endophytica]MDN3595068.1 alpha/beta hydrolase [Zunongwangia endophytica]
MKNFILFLSFCSLLFTNHTFSQSSFEVTKYGSGEPILLLPGFTSTSEVYKTLIEDLSKNHEIHAFTFAGFGDVAPIPTPWLKTIKEDIETYVIKNKLKNPVIIGHSMGGTLGLWLTSENANFKKLILIDALPAMGALMLPNYNSDAIAYENPYNELLLKMDTSEFKNMAIQMAIGMSTNPEDQELITKDFMKADRKTYVYGYTDLLKLDLRQKLSNIDIPVYILAADLPYGKETAEKNYKNQYENLKSYELIFAKNSKHFIMYDQPEWLKDEINIALSIDE